MGARVDRCLVCIEPPGGDHGCIVPDQDPLTRSTNGRVQRAEVGRDFEILPQVLGTGYSGGVRLAQSLTTRQRVAVKQFSKRSLEPHQLELLHNEVEVYLRLDHPNICRLLRAYETKHDVSLVMELCGATLHKKLAERKTYHEKHAADLMLQMLQAVNYLHSHNVVHRDLKLENWMYGATERDDRLKLIDFGLSRLLRTPDESLAMPCGTLYYASPELLSQKYTSKCDIWSLGIISYMLLVGKPPFRGPTSFVLGEAIMDPKRDFHKDGRWNSLSADAQNFVTDLLQKDDSKRPSASQALQHHWIRMVATTTTFEACETGIDVLKCLQEFARGSHLRRAALTMIAYSLTSRELEELEDAFLAIDRSGRGTITYDHLAEVMHEHLNISSEEASRIFQSLDFSHSEELNYTPFMAATLAPRVKLHEDKVRPAFERFVAQDGSNLITAASLVETFNGFSVPGKTGSIVNRSLTHSDAQEWIREIDYKGNGVVDYESFLAAVMGKKLRASTSFDETDNYPTVRVFDRLEDEENSRQKGRSFGFIDVGSCRRATRDKEQAADSVELECRPTQSFKGLGFTGRSLHVGSVRCKVDESYFGRHQNGLTKEALQGG